MKILTLINALVKGAYGQLLNYFHASLKLERKERCQGAFGAFMAQLRRRWPECWPATKSAHKPSGVCGTRKGA